MVLGDRSSCAAVEYYGMHDSVIRGFRERSDDGGFFRGAEGVVTVDARMDLHRLCDFRGHWHCGKHLPAAAKKIVCSIVHN